MLLTRCAFFLQLTLLAAPIEAVSADGGADFPYASYVDQCKRIIAPAGFAKTTGDILCLSGTITRDLDSNVVRQIANHSITNVVIASGGGDVEYAINIGNLIREYDLRVIVTKACLSSCANYIFTASPHAVVLPGSVVIWHGGPGAAAGIARLKSDEFLDRIGVDKALIYGTFLRGPSGSLSAQNVGWTASPEELRNRFGMTGIEYMWFDDAAIDKLFAKYKIERLKDRRLELDAPAREPSP
jgi:hypothetical protein